MTSLYTIWLVVYLPLWKIWKSDWIIIPTIGEHKSHVPNHQPGVYIYIYICIYSLYIYTSLYGIHDIIFIIHHSLTFIYTPSCYSLTFHEQSITYHFLPVGIHNTPKVTMKNTIHEPCHKVVPQFGIAKLVPITPITLWFMLDISNYVLWLSMVIYL